MKKILLLAALAMSCLCGCNQSNTSDNASDSTDVRLRLPKYEIPFSATTTNKRDGKTVLIVSGSPRRGGNTDLLCDEFAKGALEAGGKVEKVFLCDYDLQFFDEEDEQNVKEKADTSDAAVKLTRKFLSANVVVLASPVYYMNVTDRMKCFIDRTYCAYGDERMGNKEFYYITACADPKESTGECAFNAFRGFVFCLPSATERGYINAYGIGAKGGVKGTHFMNDAYELGKTINK